MNSNFIMCTCEVFASHRLVKSKVNPVKACVRLCFFCAHQVCREYQRGNCTRGENDCRFAHPSDSTMIDTNDNTVTVCMDYIKGRCSREKCKYFHPPAHLQAKIKAAQHQVNQAAAAAAMVGICRTGHSNRGALRLEGICCNCRKESLSIKAN